jgi:hypothetical protein
LLGVALHYAFYFDTEKYKDLQDRFNATPSPPILTVAASAPSVVSEAPSVSGPSESNFCRRCGAPMQSGDVFCGRCGAPNS